MREKVSTQGQAQKDSADQARKVAIAAMQQLNGVFVQREQAIETIWLALLTGVNFLLVGDPGTAKTALVHAAYSHVSDARQFGMLCGSFATEDKVFGPVDIQGFKEGRWGRVTKKRLADCELAFLDEMLKSNEGTLNGMLTALNERTYEGEPIPLWTCGAATNWPEVKARSENVAALWDRMLLRCHVREVTGDKARLELLSAADRVAKYRPEHTVTMDQLRAAQAQIAEVQVTEAVRSSLLDVEKRLNEQGIKNSSRRIAALQTVLRAKAWLRGSETGEPLFTALDDFDVLDLGLWNDEAHIEPLRAIISTVDAKVVQECVQKLQSVNQQCSASGVPVGQIPRLIKIAAEAANQAKADLQRHGARTEGRARIAAEIKKLKATYEKLKAQVEPHLADR